MNLFITGANGFVGRQLIERLLSNHPDTAITCLAPNPGADVRVIPDSQSETDRYYQSLSDRGITIVRGDITTQSVFASDFTSPTLDAVIHLAANNVKSSSADHLMAINGSGTHNVLTRLGESLNGARVVLTSTFDVLEPKSYPSQPPDESYQPAPTTHYGRSKHQAEKALHAAAEKLNFTPITLRLSSVYGPTSRTGAVYDAWRFVTERSPFARIDFPGHCGVVHVEDVVRILIEKAIGSESPQQLYHIAESESPTVGSIMALFAQSCGLSGPKLPIPRLAGHILWLPGLRRLVPSQLKAVTTDSFRCDTTRIHQEFPDAWHRLADEIEMLTHVYGGNL